MMGLARGMLFQLWGSFGSQAYVFGVCVLTKYCDGAIEEDSLRHKGTTVGGYLFLSRIHSKTYSDHHTLKQQHGGGKKDSRCDGAPKNNGKL